MNDPAAYTAFIPLFAIVTMLISGGWRTRLSYSLTFITFIGGLIAGIFYPAANTPLVLAIPYSFLGMEILGVIAWLGGRVFYNDPQKPAELFT